VFALTCFPVSPGKFRPPFQDEGSDLLARVAQKAGRAQLRSGQSHLLEQLADLPKAEVDALIRAMAPGAATAFQYEWRYLAWDRRAVADSGEGSSDASE
jgi:hypothetical protein